MPKSIGTTAPAGKLLTICECRNETCEAAAIANFISTLKTEDIKPNEMVVLYRLHRVGVEMQPRLQAKGVLCMMKVAGSDESTRSVKGVSSTGEAFADVIAILRLILNESDDYACKRLLVLVCPDDHAEVTSYMVKLQQKSTSASLLQSLKTIRSHLLGLAKDCSEIQSLEQKFGDLKEVTKGLHILLKILADTKEELQRLGMKDVVMNLLQQIGPYREEAKLATSQHLTSSSSGKFNFAGIKALLKEAASFDSEHSLGTFKTSPGSVSKNKNASYKDMRKVRKRDHGQSVAASNSADYTERLRLFLDQVAMQLHEYELGEENLALHSSSDFDFVTLSTIHQAKGLEWKAVVLARANEEVLPVLDTELIAVGEDVLEEERRLMYVALTRAKTSILITYLINDGGQRVFPSRFLSDIPRGLVNKISCYDPNERNL